VPTGPLDEAAVEQAIQAQIDEITGLWSRLDGALGCPVLKHVVELPEDLLIGAAEARLPWAPTTFVGQVNRRLRAAAPRFVYWLDVDSVAAEVGRRNWFDPRLHYLAKFGFNPRHVPEYAQLFRGAWCHVKGGTKKCLVLDLDNTLWGGVVGDEGVEGIRLGPGSPEGEAFRDFALYVKALKDRGVILAVCSKNDLALASEVFERHPSMPLRLEDFAAFYCNWDDKPSNLRRLAKELNVDLSSMVLVDDNAAERELVRQELPEVVAIELPDDPSLFRRAVDSQRYFDSAQMSPDDLLRAQSYAGRRRMMTDQAATTDIGSYLRSLDMRGAMFRATHEDLSRLAQMELKTNQFNVTTRRYSEHHLAQYLRQDGAVCLALRLRDRFADHGLVSSMVIVREGDDLRIDSWLMSCRVFSRTAEEFMMNGAVELGRQLGARRLVGQYVATAKNAVVAELYPRLGFVSDPDRGTGWWTLDIGQVPVPLSTFVTAAGRSE
jgi:FkbH-like protein